MRLVTKKSPERVLDELRLVLRPGKLEKRLRLGVFRPLRQPPHGMVIGEITGDRFWVMQTVSGGQFGYTAGQRVFYGRICENENGTMIRGHFAPQPCIKRIFWMYVILAAVIDLGCIVLGERSPYLLILLAAATVIAMAILNLCEKLLYEKEEQQIRSLLRRTAQEEADKS